MRRGNGIDVAGIWSALAKLPDRSPADRRLDRQCRDVHRRSGSVPSSAKHHHSRRQPRDERGRFA